MVRQLLAVSPVTVLGLYSHIISPPQPRLMLVHYWVTTVPAHWVSVRQSVTLCAKCPAYCWQSGPEKPWFSSSCRSHQIPS